ncbi:hypothetical protein MTBBW1_10092 [Desulfamplus magnetovallimortis]|uniref:Uncharacterized protein n=1 Tax=Desulfamplus magnetovallimortis TaxID=1246637 RepID=A0A1W1H4M4_9BACT|nr:hypothetical protein MTBBW1_10092 [Desulfamplus magnetovallimortis]
MITLLNGHGGRSATLEHKNNVSIYTINGHDCVSINPKYKNDSHFHGKRS